MNYSLKSYRFAARALMLMVLITLASIPCLPTAAAQLVDDEVDPNPSGFSTWTENPSKSVDDEVDPNPSGRLADSASDLRAKKADPTDSWISRISDLLEYCMQLLKLSFFDQI